MKREDEAMAMQIRRVVSGEVGGKAKVVSDEIVTAASLDGTSQLALIWSGDEAPRFPLSGKQPKTPVYFPTLGGYRFVIFTVPPEGEAVAARARLTPEAQAKSLADLEAHIGTGLTDWMEPDHPGMHTTDTIDFEVILSGEVWLELDDGEEVHLKEGDTFVQNGTRHRWFNRGKVPAKIAVVLIGGHPR
jgi:mannose-6-phosphate isomerase-like protein (cupin superfamily)